MKQAIFSMGLPAAGKSTILARDYSTIQVLDCDKIKKAHPDYDPKDPAPLHAWSQAVLSGQFETTLAGETDFILDGTGTDFCKMAGDITAARLAGFTVTILFVHVPLAVSLERNAARSRNVPERIIHDKAQQINAAFAQLQPLADNVLIIDNSQHQAK